MNVIKTLFTAHKALAAALFTAYALSCPITLQAHLDNTTKGKIVGAAIGRAVAVPVCTLAGGTLGTTAGFFISWTLVTYKLLKQSGTTSSTKPAIPESTIATIKHFLLSYKDQSPQNYVR